MTACYLFPVGKKKKIIPQISTPKDLETLNA